MLHLSPVYNEIRQLRSQGHCSAAIAKLRARPPNNDFDAFEAVVCLFVCGEFEAVLNVCRTHAWKTRWAADIIGALSESLRGGDATHALALARKAVRGDGAPYDAAGSYTVPLKKTGLCEQAGGD